MDKAPELLSEIRKYAYSHKASPVIGLLVDEILSRHHKDVMGILYYGSCLQSGNETDGILDLFVVVESYLSAYKRPFLAFINWLLPPNVFYLELPFGEHQKIRAKYAMISLWDLRKMTSHRTFHSYFWARFCQPVAIIYCRHKRIEKVIEDCLASSIITFLKATIPCMPGEFTARQLWLTGLGLSYGAELRPERHERLTRLWQEQGHVLEAVTNAAIRHVPYEICRKGKPKKHTYLTKIGSRSRLMCQTAWKVRTIQGKLLSIIRLFKATFTFKGGVDYALWKIRRHSGLDLEVGPFMRRHPGLAMLVLSWKLLRKHAIR